MTTAIIAEDEDLLRATFEARLREAWPGLEIVAVCEDGASALEEASAREPDLAFLDIRMPGLNGLDVAQALAAQRSRTHVVFVTAYEQHAIEAFERGAVDYLLKPVKPERLAQAVARLKARLGSTQAALGTAPAPEVIEALAAALAAQAPGARAPLRWITAGVGQETRLIMVDDIVHIQADNKYSVVTTADGEALIRKPIKELVAGLDPEVFWQVHRSTIVNLRMVKSVVRDETGRGLIRLKGRGETLSVSQPFMHRFRNM
jgi:DNA-binding LytR/AlgR family response regulator